MGPGHTGIVGTELADYKATQGVHIGMAKGEKNIATPVGIRQHFRKRRQLKEWDRDAMRGYTYIYTDKGPFMYLLHKIGRKDRKKCSCSNATVQNAALPREWQMGKGERRNKWRSFAGKYSTFASTNINLSRS